MRALVSTEPQADHLVGVGVGHRPHLLELVIGERRRSRSKRRRERPVPVEETLRVDQRVAIEELAESVHLVRVGCPVDERLRVGLDHVVDRSDGQPSEVVPAMSESIDVRERQRIVLRIEVLDGGHLPNAAGPRVGKLRDEGHPERTHVDRCVVDSRLCRQHAEQHRPHEVLFGVEFGRGEAGEAHVPVDDAPVVGPVPGRRRRCGVERQPCVDRGCRARARRGILVEEQMGLDAVTDQLAVHRPPPHAPRPRCVERVHRASADLPFEERQLPLGERGNGFVRLAMTLGGPLRKLQPRRRIVGDKISFGVGTCTRAVHLPDPSQPAESRITAACGEGGRWESRSPDLHGVKANQPL